MSSITAAVPLAERALGLHPDVSLRPEPFGALAYHHGTRRLVFLKHTDVVAVVRALGDHGSVAATLAACRIAPDRAGAFERAIAGLLDSGMLVERTPESA